MAKNRLVSLVVAFIGAGVVTALLKFNYSTSSYNQYMMGNLLAIFFVPMMTILLIFREDPDKFGFILSGSKRVWALTGVLFIGMFALLVVVCKWHAFQSQYPLFKWYWEFQPAFIKYPDTNPFLQAPLLMLYAEATYGMYLFCWEFFFRGYLLFGMLRSIGWWAVIIQAVAFGMLHYGKPMPEMIASFGAGILLGIIAMNAKSFVPGFVLHWATSISLDLLVVFTRHH